MGAATLILIGLGGGAAIAYAHVLMARAFRLAERQIERRQAELSRKKAAGCRRT